MVFSLKRNPRSTKAVRVPRNRSHRAALELLEERRLLSFAAPVSYSVGTQNSLGLNGFGPQVATGDFTGNGELDLAVTNTADGTLSILMGNGDGTFQPAVTYNTGLGANNPVFLTAADLNGDGKLDIAVEGGNSVSVLLNNGNGTFAAPKVYATGTGVRGGVAVADYFGNGKEDIAVVAFSTNNIQILPGNGDGTFGAPVIVAMPAAFHNIRSIVEGNFFGNGHADLAIAGNEGYNNVLSPSDPAGVALFKNDGAGHFTYQAEYLAAVTPDPGGGTGQGDTVNPEHVNAADLNGDGKPDLVLSLYDHNIDVYLNNGDGTFKPAVAYTTETPGALGGYPRGVAFGDFNNDGKIDIATLNFGEPKPADQPTPEPGSIGILYGNGDGTFQAPIQYTPYQLPGGVAVGDFNGDGLPDLAVTQNYTGHVVGVMLNQPNTAQEPPTVTGISPGNGPTAGGTVVTITGANFTGTTQVDFGSIPAKAFTVNSDTSITATAPAEPAGTVDVSVYNAGASAIAAADAFTYKAAAPAPIVTGVSPAVGSTSGGTVVTITGTNFTAATQVKFGGSSAVPFTVNSPTTITATAPPEPPGIVDVTVTTAAGGTSAASAADHFTYQAPRVASITVTPATVAVADGFTQAFAATAFDQFGKPLAPPPTVAWSVAGIGSITNTGLYSAPAAGVGKATVTASSGGISGTAAVTVVLAIDTWTGLGSTFNWSDPANWSMKAVPGAGVLVKFDGTSSKDSIVDAGFAGTVAGVLMNPGFAGTIGLNNNLSVTGAFTENAGNYYANGYTTIVYGQTTIHGGSIEPSTNTQWFWNGLVVSGGTFNGSTGMVVAGNVTLSSGTLTAPTAFFDVTGGNFTYTGGTFNANKGIVVYTGMNVAPTVSVGTGLISFYNFTDDLVATNFTPVHALTISGTLTVNGTFSWQNSANAIYGQIEARGNVDGENHGGIGNPYLTLDGSANQTIEDLSGSGGQYRTITINKTGGTVILACNPIVFSGLTLTAGAVNTGAFSWFDTGPMSASAGLNLGSVTIDGSNASVVGTNLQVANVSFATSSTKLTAPSGTLSVSGNWNDSAGGGFVSNGGTVVFDGTPGTQFLTSGGPAFNNLTIVAGSTVELEADVIVAGTFTNLGTLIANGHKILK